VWWNSILQSPPIAALCAALCAALRARRGVAAMEFALVGTTMVMLLLAAYDVGSAVHQRMVLADAVHSAGAFAEAFPTNTTGMTAAITAALPATMTGVSTGTSCGCINSGGATTTAASCDLCPAGTVGRTITLTATRAYSPFYFTAITGNSAQYVVRIQ
jgi:Flp pilus assembly protein TadG